MTEIEGDLAPEEVAELEEDLREVAPSAADDLIAVVSGIVSRVCDGARLSGTMQDLLEDSRRRIAKIGLVAALLASTRGVSDMNALKTVFNIFDYLGFHWINEHLRGIIAGARDSKGSVEQCDPN